MKNWNNTKFKLRILIENKPVISLFSIYHLFLLVNNGYIRRQRMFEFSFLIRYLNYNVANSLTMLGDSLNKANINQVSFNHFIPCKILYIFAESMKIYSSTLNIVLAEL